MKITAKIHLLVNPDQSNALRSTMIEANTACNSLSEYAFIHKRFKQFDLHKEQYYTIKDSFNLSSQVIIRCISKVADSYKVDKKVQRKFKLTGAITYDDRILTLNIEKSIVSLWTINGRLKVSYRTDQHNQRLLQYRKGEVDLVLVKNNFYLLCTCDIPDESTDEFEDVLGIDMGIVSIATDSDGQSFSGVSIEQNRQWHQKRRDILQSIGTKSAKRRLKKLSGKQKNFQKHTNHVISKQLVKKAKDPHRAIALEDLKGISKLVRKDEKRLQKSQRNKHSNWSFYQLRTFITYKAQMQGVSLFLVKPAYTSRTCCKCGHCAKENRKSQSEFVCVKCSHSMNADWNAAINIKILGYIRQPMVATA